MNKVIKLVAREVCDTNNGMLEPIPGHGNEGAKHACVMTGNSDTSVDFGLAFCMDVLNGDGTFKA